MRRTRKPGNRIVCPECGYLEASRYDYDPNGTPGVYAGYCPGCKKANNSTGTMRLRWDDGRWVVIWKASPPKRAHKRCEWCDARLSDTNKTGYCRKCREQCAPKVVSFAVCQYRNCRRWFTHRKRRYRAYCSAECNRSETNRQAQERVGKKPRRHSIKTNKRYQVAYRYGYKCALCRKLLNLGAKPTASNAMEIDHIIEVALGGTEEISNLRPLCRPCHRARRLGDTAQLQIA